MQYRCVLYYLFIYQKGAYSRLSRLEFNIDYAWSYGLRFNHGTLKRIKCWYRVYTHVAVFVEVRI